MNKIILLVLSVLITACQSLTTETGTKGVNFGDAYLSVLATVGKSHRIAESTADKIVAYGKRQSGHGCVKYTYQFMGGALAMVSNVAAESEELCEKQ